MAQAKIVTEQELKRALSILRDRRHADRDKLALLLTHWAGMRVCEVAALTRDKVLGPAGEVLEEKDEAVLHANQTQSDNGYCTSNLRPRY
jgi:integrase/recombinase XerD